MARDNLKPLINPTENMIKKATILREKHIEEAIRFRAEDQIKQVSKTAAKAHQIKDYKLVIELLTPYEFILKRSDLSKLNNARKQILSPN